MPYDKKQKPKKKKEDAEDLAYTGVLINKLIACGLAFAFLWWLASLAWNAITTSWPW